MNRHWGRVRGAYYRILLNVLQSPVSLSFTLGLTTSEFCFKWTPLTRFRRLLILLVLRKLWLLVNRLHVALPVDAFSWEKDHTVECLKWESSPSSASNMTITLMSASCLKMKGLSELSLLLQLWTALPSLLCAVLLKESVVRRDRGPDFEI